MNPQEQDYNNMFDDGTKSVVLSLETLSIEYANVLKQYQQTQLDYVNYLKKQSETPCGKYNANSKAIDQRCYEHIWKRSGCTKTGVVNASGEWQKARTLNELIYDSFLWATMTDKDHRMGCYGSVQSTYMIIGVGTDGNLYSREGLDSNWNFIKDDSNTNVRSLCTGNDGKMIICSNRVNDISTKSKWNDTLWYNNTPNRCCVMSVAMGQDGTLVGVGMDYQLWSKPSLNGSWTKTSSAGEWISSICIAPNGNLFCIGGGNQLWKKNSYKNLTSQGWQGIGCCCVKAITIAPDGTFIGVGTDNQLWIKDSYLNMTTPWKGPYKNSCCVIGITTIANPNYDGTKYSSATAANYDINKPDLTNVPGSTFWGTGRIGEPNASSLEQCQALCASTSGCSGATFNPTDHGKPYCWLRSGNGDISAGLQKDYAIVPKSVMYLKLMKSLNERLTSINQQIMNTTAQGQPIYENQDAERGFKNDTLKQNYDKLVVEKNKIIKTLREYDDLTQEQTEGEMYINKSQAFYIILFIIAVIAVILLIKFTPLANIFQQQGTQQGGALFKNPNMIVLVIIIALALVLYCYNSNKMKV